MNFIEPFPDISNNYKDINHSVIHEESSEQTLDNNSNLTLNQNQSRKLVINHLEIQSDLPVGNQLSASNEQPHPKKEPINEESELESSISDSIDIEDYHEVLVDEKINEEVVPTEEGEEGIKKSIKEIARSIKQQERILKKQKSLPCESPAHLIQNFMHFNLRGATRHKYLGQKRKATESKEFNSTNLEQLSSKARIQSPTLLPRTLHERQKQKETKKVQLSFKHYNIPTQTV